VRNEAAHYSSFFTVERLSGPRDLVGMGAAIYSAAVGAVMRGLDDEAELAIGLFRDAARGAGVTETPDMPAALLRYIRLNRAVACLVRKDADAFVAVLGDLVAAHNAALAAAAAANPERWAAPSEAAAYFDTSSGALIGIAVLKGLLPETNPFAGGEFAPYGELLEAMRTVDRSEADEEAAARAREEMERSIQELEAMGVAHRQTVAVAPAPSGAASGADGAGDA